MQQAGVDVQAGQDENQGWWYVSPQECVGHYRYSLEGTEESLSRQQARTEAIALLNAMAPLVQTGAVNVRALLERVAIAYDIPDPESLVAPAPQGPPAAAPQLGQGPQGSPMMNGGQLPLGPQAAIWQHGGT